MARKIDTVFNYSLQTHPKHKKEEKGEEDNKVTAVAADSFMY
jgi:hypothetical protein